MCNCGKNLVEVICFMYVWAKNLWIHPEKLTWQWKTNHLKMYLLLKMVISHCHVRFQEGIHTFRFLDLTQHLKPSKTYVKTVPASGLPKSWHPHPGCITQWQPAYDRNPRTVWNSSSGMAKNFFMAEMVAPKEKSWILMRMKQSWKSNKWRNPIWEPFNWDLENLIR